MNKNNKSPISRVNNYMSELTAAQIQSKHHRDKIGGLWEEVGNLQLEFFKKKGLLPEHKLLDIGCGCLRGGVKFIDYLNDKSYFGMDINQSLIAAGKIEVEEANLSHKHPNLIVDSNFDIYKFNIEFDYMNAFSLFTHLHMNLIIKCLNNAYKHLKKDGKFFATFFIAEEDIQEKSITGVPEKIKTHFDMDPFHYSFNEIEMMAKHTNFSVTKEEDFNHPRGQSVVCFAKL